MEKKMPYSADNNNSIQSRSCSLNFTTNSKMGFDESSKTVNGNKHSTIWKLSEVSSLRNEETARATAGLAEIKCLRNKCISKLDNELHRERSIPEIQKFKDVNWTELFLDQFSIGDSCQSVLDHCIFKKMIQNNRDKDKKPDTFDPKLLHANIFNSSVAFVNNSENFEQETPGTSVNNNTLRPANIISDSIQAAKYNNENYFWAPLSDSSDEEWTNRTKNNLKWPTMDSKNYKNFGDSANFDNPTIMKYFSSSMLEGEFVFKIMPGSCEKWNPGIETLQIQEYKCKNFTQTPKYEDFSGKQNSIKSNHEESKNGNINFLSKFTVQKDMLRDQMSDIQPLERASDQRNESKLQQMLEMDKIFKGRKYIGEQDVNFKKATYQKDTELTSPLDYPLEIRSSSVSSLLKPSENYTYKEPSDSLNHSPKGMNKSNSDCVLLVGPSQISDDQVIHKPCIISKNEQGAINDNISATGLKPADGAKEFPTATIKWDGHEKSFCSNTIPLDFSHSDGVLAKYYFYLNYLNESKRFRCENAHQFFFCQEHDFFKEAYYDTGPCYCKNDSMYEEQTDENMNHDLGTSEGKERTEIIKQQNHFKDQMLKPQFANSSPKQMERTDSFKDQEVFESRKSSPKQASPKKHWERANISCSSYTQRELKPRRSQCVRRPATGKKLMRKNNYNFQNQTSSGTQCRLQYENASQGYNKLKMKSDCSLTPWLLLPDELWLCIFSLLTHKDISRISQACRHFYQLAGDKFLWKKIQLKDCHCLNNDWLISLGKHHPECFTLDHCHDKDHRISEVGLKQFFQYCEGYLKELNIKNCSGSGYKGDRILLHASTFCYNLAVVDISWTGTTDFGLDALVKGSRSLQCFSANGCQITNESVMALIGKHGKSLKKLEMFGCQAITDKCLKSISTKCLGLEVLNIGRVYRISQDCLVQTVNSLQKLTSLNVTGLEMVRDSLVHYIVKCPKLDCLVLNSCAHITDISLIEISRDLPGIRYLDVNGCKDVSDIGVQALARNCHKLSYLDLSSTATSKRGVCLLANFCFNILKCLKLSFCRNISLDAVVKLCKNCKRLQILHLYGCHFIPDLESITKVNKTVKIFHDLTIATVKLLPE